jgi:hypothetical protein
MRYAGGETSAVSLLGGSSDKVVTMKDAGKKSAQ